MYVCMYVCIYILYIHIYLHIYIDAEIAPAKLLPSFVARPTKACMPELAPELKHVRAL